MQHTERLVGKSLVFLVFHNYHHWQRHLRFLLYLGGQRNGAQIWYGEFLQVFLSANGTIHGVEQPEYAHRKSKAQKAMASICFF